MKFAMNLRQLDLVDLMLTGDEHMYLPPEHPPFETMI